MSLLAIPPHVIYSAIEAKTFYLKLFKQFVIYIKFENATQLHIGLKQTEKANATLMQSLSHYTSANQKDWDVNLPALLFGIRVVSSPTTGESPFYLLYGREPVLPLEVPLKPPNKVPTSIDAYRSQLVQKLQLTHQVAQEQIQLSEQRMKDFYDRDSKPYPYKLGDRVWIFNLAIKPGFSKKLLY